MKVGKLFIIIFILLSVSLSAEKNYGVDLPLYGNLSLVIVPGAFESIKATGGVSVDLGLGMYYKASNRIRVSGGIHFWNKVFNPTYTGDYATESYDVDGKIEEEGLVSYTGIYFLVTSEKNNFFFGGGFDFSFATSYKSDISFYDEQNQLIDSINGNEESILTEEFNSQFDLLLNMGFNVEVSENINIKPSVMFTIPCIKMFDTGVYGHNYYNDADEEIGISIFQIKFGLNIEYKL